jgi:hypothetical protein
MTTTSHYERLPIYKSTIDLAVRIDSIVKGLPGYIGFMMRRAQVYPQTWAIGLPLIVTPCTRDAKVVFTAENLIACPMYTFTLVHLVFRAFIRFDL